MSTDADPYLRGHGDPTFAVRHYDLDLDYRITSNHLSGRATIRVEALTSLTELGLDLDGLEATSVKVDGANVRYTHRRSRLTVRPASPVAPGEEIVVVVDYRGHPGPLPGPWGEAGWEELEDGVLVAGQPHGAPSWFPCNDRPADKAPYRMSITTAADYYVAANGILTSARRRASTTTWVYEQAEPMASYLATVQIGRYVNRELVGPVPLEVVLPPRRAGLAEKAGLGRQPEMLEAFIDLFGPYPFAGYRVVVTDEDLEIPLEATGMAVFGTNFLTDDWEAERLVAHELAHQWFGNSVTLGAWHDIWLHEGFACYAEWLWSEASGGAAAEEHARKHWKRLSGLPQDLVLADPGPDDMFDDRVYKRGALALHALRTTVGDDPFFALLREWTSRHAHGTVDTQDLITLAGEVSGQDLSELFEAWLFAPPLPPLPEPRD
jgi:aminopeptidase N